MKVNQIDGRVIGGTQAIELPSSVQLAKQVEHARYLDKIGVLGTVRRTNAYGTDVYVPDWTIEGAIKRTTLSNKLGRVLRRARLWKAA